MTRRETQIHAHTIAEALEGHAHLQGTGYMGRSSIAYAVLEALRVRGYVVRKLTTVKKHEQDRDILRHRIEWLEDEARQRERSREKDYAEMRRLSERLTFVYGQARAAKVSVEDLTGPCPSKRGHNRCEQPEGHSGFHTARQRKSMWAREGETL